MARRSTFNVLRVKDMEGGETVRVETMARMWRDDNLKPFHHHYYHHHHHNNNNNYNYILLYSGAHLAEEMSFNAAVLTGH